MKNFLNKQKFILIPIYNDWKSLELLLEKIKNIYNPKKIKILIINDASKKRFNIKKNKIKIFSDFKIINLKKNIGSQRALSIGIKYVSKKYKNYQMIIMDGDGEDNPELIKTLFKFSNIYPNDALVVTRTSRREGFIIKILYEIYFLISFILILIPLRFGNYSLINNKIAKKILKDDSYWFAYPPALLKNADNMRRLYAKKDFRNCGKSQMSYKDLLIHAIRIITPFKNRILITSIIYSSLIIFFIENSFVIKTLLIIFFLLNLFIQINYYIIKKKKPKNIFSLIKKIESI